MVYVFDFLNSLVKWKCFIHVLYNLLNDKIASLTNVLASIGITVVKAQGGLKNQSKENISLYHFPVLKNVYFLDNVWEWFIHSLLFWENIY